MIKKYIKKLVEIEAIQLKEDNIIEVFNFLDNTNYEEIKSRLELDEMVYGIKEQGYIGISTLEGYMKASFGDYIIKDEYSEYRVFDEKEFKKLYKEVR